MKVELLSSSINSETLVALASKLCYSSADLEGLKGKVSEEDQSKFIKMLKSMGHESPFEHATFTFGIEGVSRACTHQLVRHRLASYCLSGETVVFRDMSNRSVKKSTIKELYNLKPQYLKNMKLRSVDESNHIITSNGIVSIVYSGKKEVYEVKTVDGYKIKTTLDHKFYTPQGWKRLKELNIRDEVYTNGEALYKDRVWLEKQYIENGLSQEEIGELCGVTKHTIRSWVRKYKLQKPLGSWSIGVEPPNKGRTREDYEPLLRTSIKMKGNMNNNQGRREANTNWKKDKLTRSGHYSRVNRYYPKTGVCKMCGKEGVATEIHHINKEVETSNHENLIELCVTCHKVVHKGMVVKHIKTSKIASIKRVGVEDTYDIEMKDPHHNFIGNGFVVHNSQQSQRYVKLEQFEYIVPPEIESIPEAKEKYIEGMEQDQKLYNELVEILQEKYYSREIEGLKEKGKEITEDIEKKLKRQVEKKAIEDARYVFPNACETKIIVTMNTRSLYNFFKHRCCERSQWEIRGVADEMLRKVKEVAPMLFENVGASCVSGGCPEGVMTCGKIKEIREKYRNM